MNIIGRVTKDAEVRTLSNSKQVVNFSVATNDSYRNKAGERVEQTTYFDCAYWISPKAANILTKGTLVELTGRVSARAWTGNDGEARAGLNFNTAQIKLHGGRQKSRNYTSSHSKQQRRGKGRPPILIKSIQTIIIKFLKTFIMAHNINFTENTGRYSFFSVKEKAWHGLGQIVEQYPTSAEAIKHAGLDYEVTKSPLYTKGSGVIETANGIEIGNSELAVPNYFANIRSDNNTVLGVVGKDYHIVQNREAFNFFDAIVGGGEGILYETAGALGQGERIFITAKLPGYIRVGNGDDVTEKYIFLTTSHDGSGSITAAFTPIRIVCQNTLNASLRSMSNVVRIRHTSGAKQRLDDAHKVMGLANTLSNQLEDIFNNWAKVKVTDREVRKLIQLALCPNKETFDLLKKGAEDELSTLFKNTVEDAFAYAMVSDSQQMDTTKGTLFGAYNAVTGYYQNVRNYKDDEAKLQSIVMGGTAQLKSQKAFELCTSFATDGAGILTLN